MTCTNSHANSKHYCYVAITILQLDIITKYRRAAPSILEVASPQPKEKAEWVKFLQGGGGREIFK